MRMLYYAWLGCHCENKIWELLWLMNLNTTFLLPSLFQPFMSSVTEMSSPVTPKHPPLLHTCSSTTLNHWTLMLDKAGALQAEAELQSDLLKSPHSKPPHSGSPPVSPVQPQFERKVYGQYISPLRKSLSHQGNSPRVHPYTPALDNSLCKVFPIATSTNTYWSIFTCRMCQLSMSANCHPRLPLCSADRSDFYKPAVRLYVWRRLG